jgi:hypothetical protein
MSAVEYEVVVVASYEGMTVERRARAMAEATGDLEDHLGGVVRGVGDMIKSVTRDLADEHRRSSRSHDESHQIPLGL